MVLRGACRDCGHSSGGRVGDSMVVSCEASSPLGELRASGYINVLRGWWLWLLLCLWLLWGGGCGGCNEVSCGVVVVVMLVVVEVGRGGGVGVSGGDMVLPLLMFETNIM